MDSTFLKLIDGTRIRNYMRLEMDEGIDYLKGTNYLYIDIPARPRTEEVKRNMHVFLEAAGTVDPKGRQIIEVEPNPALAEFGQVQPSYRIHPETGLRQLGVWFTAHKQLELDKLDYLVRIYMYA